ncbi:MAG: N-acetylmuramoyl-L-alanine amidase [Thermoleophilia bacterium]
MLCYTLLMANRPPRDASTAELLERLRKRRALQRRLKIAAAAFLGTAFLIVAGVAAVAAIRGPSDPDAHTPPGTGATLADVATTTASTSPPTTRNPPPRPSTTAESSATEPPASSTTTPTGSSGAGFVVVIDPGHQRRGNNAEEPIGPGSSETKPKVSSGTSGVSSGIDESEVVLAVSLKLRDALEARGVTVIMTRTTQDVDLSNIERTRIANDAGAGLYIRVHADGADGSSTRGIHVLYPASIAGWTDDIATPSKRAAQLAQAALVAATGAQDRGTDARSDMTGFNWSDVPVIIPEIGFMTNPEEDRLLNTASYQQKIADALADAAVRFLGAQG